MTELKRGANVALTREIPDLPGLVVGVRWKSGAERILDENLVVAAVLCDAGGKALSAEHFVFFNQLGEPGLSVSLLEQVLGEDAEQVEIDFAAVPPAISRIVVVLYLNEGTGLRRSLGRLRELGVRALDPRDNRELVRSENLAAVLNGETALSLGEVYRHHGGWKFKVIGESYPDGVLGLAKDYGVPL
ncbi:TerD family protein [Amycolatopsis sp. H20-H5]|uniref:TerD family protein n=1 Tax=Amycolatopsis sp. H20-H5 TaxID=3046309 RepID=UPI002DBB5E22|nr:TerD family protein [Amycolatopsis sp. H20-H5]MEC3982134.1 TerD family protein [Amycolatopsis sp. H20-H5]